VRRYAAADAPAELLVVASGAPLVVAGAAAGWPAVQRWADPEYLRTVAGANLVPVELGTSYLAHGTCAPFPRAPSRLISAQKRASYMTRAEPGCPLRWVGDAAGRKRQLMTVTEYMALLDADPHR
jgi:hypothetical protein